MTNKYDAFQRRTNLSALKGGMPIVRQSFAFDRASRLLSVAQSTSSATYSYLANSPLVSQISFTNSTVQRMVTTKQYDLLNRLTNISSSSSSSFSSSFSYQYSPSNQRTKRTDADSSYWSYSYDTLGQVTSGKKYWPDNTAVAGQQFEYSFDDIGNRQSASFDGDQNGANLRRANYSANNLNQYTTRDLPGYLEVTGSAKTNTTVSLWTADGYYASTSRKGEYYAGELALNNSTGALWLTITNLAVLNNGTNADIITNATGNAFVARNPEPFTYDLDGNLTRDGRWTNTWDAENRLISMESLSSAPAASKLRLSFRYDSNWRRISKKVETWSGSAWITTLSNKFLYDGWNLIAEVNGTNNATIRTYTWGTDLSGTMQGAGGVGGLLAVTDATLGSHFAAFDGNGNVSTLISAADGTNSANYEYSAFGELIRATGLMARTNPFRFSNKFQDDETGFSDYGFRYYSSAIGRWLSRDSRQELGGLNVYGFVNNNPQLWVDTDGRGMFSLPLSGVNGPPSSVSVVAYVEQSTGDNSSAFSLGWDWLTGTSATTRTFVDRDLMAEQMKSSPEARRTRDALLNQIKNGCRVGSSEPFFRSLGAEPKAEFYKGFWQDFFGRNPTRAFLGGFSGDATVIKCIGCCAVVQFTLHDPVGWQSGTRMPPPYGYDSNRPALFETPGNPVASGVGLALGLALHQELDSNYIPSSIFPDDAFGPFGRNINVDIKWKEILCPPGSLSR